MSRKTALNKAMIRMAYDLLKEGHYIEDVTDYIGVSHNSYYQWMNRGEEIADMDEDERKQYYQDLPNETTRKNAKLYHEFYETSKRAQLEAKMAALRNIRKAGKKSWQAEAWYLERKYRHQFGRVTIVEDGKSADEARSGTLKAMIDGIDAIAQSDDSE